MDTEQRVLCLAARTRLETNEEERLLALLRGPLDWERLWAQGHLHEVLPLLTESLRRLRSRVDVPDGWMERAQRRLYATHLCNTTLAGELIMVVGALREAGVEPIPIKGVVLAETLYGNLALRPAADVDVLVRPDDLPAAREVLRALGFVQRVEPLFEELHHPFHDPQYFRLTPGGKVCLELHRGLWAAHFFRASEPFWARAAPAELRGVEVHLLSPEDTLLHLAIHRSRSPLRLRFLCDIAELLRRHGSALDWGYVLEQARQAGARTALHVALSLARELLGAPLPPGVPEQLGVGRLRRTLLERTCGKKAMFRPSAGDELAQQPHLTLRVLEQDGAGQIGRALAHTAARKGRKQLYKRRRRLAVSARP